MPGKTHPQSTAAIACGDRTISYNLLHSSTEPSEVMRQLSASVGNMVSGLCIDCPRNLAHKAKQQDPA